MSKTVYQRCENCDTLVHKDYWTAHQTECRGRRTKSLSVDRDTMWLDESIYMRFGASGTEQIMEFINSKGWDAIKVTRGSSDYNIAMHGLVQRDPERSRNMILTGDQGLKDLVDENAIFINQTDKLKDVIALLQHVLE